MAFSLVPGSVHHNLTRLLALSNNKSVTDNQVEFSNAIISASEVAVTVKAVNGQGYINGDSPFGFSLTYTRTGMHDSSNTPVWVYDISASTTFSELQQLVATGMSVPYDDIVLLSPLTANGNDTVSTHITANTCLMYATKDSVFNTSTNVITQGASSLTLLPSAISVIVRF